MVCYISVLIHSSSKICVCVVRRASYSILLPCVGGVGGGCGGSLHSGIIPWCISGVLCTLRV